jgi:hypothetical protein
MDSLSFAAPARVLTLLVPIGDITAAQFQRYTETIRTAPEVRLVDVSGTKSRVFNPQGFPQGRVLYDLQTSLDGSESLFLQDFEPYRKTFGVVGVAHGDVTANEMEQLKKEYKSVLVHVAIVFGDETANGKSNIANSDRSDVLYYSKTNMETLMCEITKLFLQELTEYHHSYQHLTLRSPRAVGEDDPAKYLANQKRRISSGASVSLSLSDPSLSKISLSTSNERRQSKLKGRQQKILGNLYLLAGNYHAALSEFHEAVNLLKTSYDYLWLGSALEGIAVCILMHSYVDSGFELNQTLIKILRQQQQHLQNSFGPMALGVSAPSQTPMTSPRSSTSSFITGNLENITNVPSTELIYQIMTKAIDYYERSRSDLQDYVPNQVYCQTILRLLKFMTVISLTASELNQQVFDSIIKGKKIKHNSLSFNQAPTFDRSNILKLSNKIFQTEFAKLNILSQVKIYTSLSTVYQDLAFHRKRNFLLRSMLLALVPAISTTNAESSSDNLNSLLNSLLSIYGVSSTSDLILEDSFSTKWVKLHKSVIKLCVSICDKVQEVSNSLLLRSLLLTKYLNTLTDNEQTTLLSEIRSTIKSNPSYALNYFDPFLIRGARLNISSNPPKLELKVPDNTKKNNDPFIYNPYANKAETAEVHLLVQGDISELILSIQNPFAFPLDITDIKIVNFETVKSSFTIPPKKLHTIIVPVKPLKSGIFNVDSISVKIFECSLQDFKIVDSIRPEVFKKLEPLHRTGDETVLLNDKEKLSNIEKRANFTKLDIRVIHSQPSLQLISPLDTILLLEGGETSLSLRFKNNSSIEINHLKFSNWDSTKTPLKSALENRSLSMNEVNEIEYFMVKNSLIVENEIRSIQPFEEFDLNVKILGKRGLNQINLFIDYGHVVGSSNEIYSRRLSIPLSVSVMNCIELASCDVIPLNFTEFSCDNLKDWKPKHTSDYALFIIDLRNTWNKSIAISVELFDFKLSEIIVPLETKRLVLPFKRFSIGKANETAKVPSLLKRQYILPQVSKNEDAFLKKVFWYRQEILNNIRGTWSVDNYSTGDIEFRGIRISQKMLNVLKIDEISIEFELRDIEFTKTGAYHCIKTDEFFTINVKVTNNSDRDVKGVLRNIPLSLTYGSIDKRLLYNGTLQQVIPNPIKSGESYQIQIGAVILETGDYEFGAVFDEFRTDEQTVSRFPMRIKVS